MHVKKKIGAFTENVNIYFVEKFFCAYGKKRTKPSPNLYINLRTVITFLWCSMNIAYTMVIIAITD